MSRVVPAADLDAFRAAYLSGVVTFKTPTPCNKCGGRDRYARTRKCVKCNRGRAKDRRRELSAEDIRDLPLTRKEAIERGQDYYFPNRRCVRGHVAKRSIRTNGCFRCAYPLR